MGAKWLDERQIRTFVTELLTSEYKNQILERLEFLYKGYKQLRNPEVLKYISNSHFAF